MPNELEKLHDPGNCAGHSVLEYKSNLSMAFLGANLLGVIAIVLMVGWTMLKGMPAMEQRIADKISPIIERIAKLEQRVDNIEKKKEKFNFPPDM